MRKLLFASLTAMMLAGCVTTGTKVDPNVVSSFQPGVTTVQEAKARLGQPNQETSESDGTTILLYQYAHAQASGSSYIPVVGAFVGSSDVSNDSTTLTFDKGGKFVKASHTTGQSSAGMINHQ
jgi:hypothetical protein